MSYELVFRVNGTKYNEVHQGTFGEENMDHMREYAQVRIDDGIWSLALIRTRVFGDVIWHNLLGHEYIQETEPLIEEGSEYWGKVWRDLDGFWHFPPQLLPF